MVRVGDPPGWSKLDGMVVEHDGNVWHLAEDQTQQPDLLTANGRARHGDYVGPWVFNELAEFLNRLRAVTRSVAYCADPSASPQSVQATYYPSGSSVSFRQT
jgi:hypothetical protein